MSFPRLYLVHQKLPDRRIVDIPAAVRRELASSGMASRLRPGSQMAIGVGSRGIANIDLIVHTVVQWWREQGMRPFLFPAMGSHGGGTAEGQVSVLAHYGITEASMGCPVRSSMEVVSTGKTPEGIPTYMDRTAFESDGIMLVSRVKWHTDFTGKVESGVFKMMAIGLGKVAGAKIYHSYGYRIGLAQVVLSVGRQILSTGKILGGLAIVEDAYHNTAKLAAIPSEELEEREAELLLLAKAWAARIPVPELDLLIVDEFGKDISGAGFDTAIINRAIQGERNTNPNAPVIHRIYVRDISPLSYGNAVGIGLADIMHARIAPKIDWRVTMVNSLTASSVPCIRTPICLPTDKECIEAIWSTSGRLEKSQVWLGWIRNTLELTTVALSENLLGMIRGNPELEIIAGPLELEFGPQGELLDVFSRNVQKAERREEK